MREFKVRAIKTRLQQLWDRFSRLKHNPSPFKDTNGRTQDQQIGDLEREIRDSEAAAAKLLSDLDTNPEA
ncbi:MAG: hypothetical protein L0Y43_00055 [Methylococcaceae bacterium]|nr:hypothetical protein [Methylococcaceae bacterium]